MTPIALAFGLLQQPGGDASDLSVVFAAQSLAALLVMPFAGLMADRVGRVRLIILSELGMGAATAAMAVLFVRDSVSLPAIAFLAVAVGTCAALWWPAYAAITPAVAGATRLEQANGALAAATTGGLLVGNLVAGVVVSAGGIAVALFLDTATFLAAALIVAWTCAGLPGSGPVFNGDRSDRAGGVFTELRGSWKQFTRRRWLVRSSVAFGVLVMAWRACKEVLGPTQAALLPDGPAQWSVILGTQSLGLFIGAVLAARARHRGMAGAFLGLSAVALWIVSLAAGAPLAVIAVIGLVAGAAVTFFEVSWYSATQRHVPDRALAHVSSMQSASVLALGPLGLAIAGPLAQAMGTGGALSVMAIVAFAAAAIGWATSRSGSATGLRRG
jgi:MFS family permease